MILKGKSLAKTLITFMFVSIMLILMVLPASASNGDAYDVNNGTLVAVNLKWLDNRADLTIPTTVKTINSNVVQEGKLFTGWYAKRTDVKTVTIPESVTTIKAGAFSNCTNLTTVAIDNYKDAVTVEQGAFPDSANVTYNKVRPTTTKPVATTAAPKVTKAPAPTTVPSVAQPVVTTAKPVTTTKAKKTKTTTTTVPVTTTEITTQVVVTEAVPFADAKAQLSDKNVWEKMASESTDAVRDPVPVKNKLANTASYAAVVVVAFSAIVLGYLKFKK